MHQEEFPRPHRGALIAGGDDDSDDPAPAHNAGIDRPVRRRRGPGRQPAARFAQLRDVGEWAIVLAIVGASSVLHDWDSSALALPDVDDGECIPGCGIVGAGMIRYRLVPPWLRDTLPEQAQQMIQCIIKTGRPSTRLAHLVYEVADVHRFDAAVPLDPEADDDTVLAAARASRELADAVQAWGDGGRFRSALRVVARISRRHFKAMTVRLSWVLGSLQHFSIMGGYPTLNVDFPTEDERKTGTADISQCPRGQKRKRKTLRASFPSTHYRSWMLELRYGMSYMLSASDDEMLMRGLDHWRRRRRSCDGFC